MKNKESLKVYYIIAPEDPKAPLKKPYQKFNDLSETLLSKDLRYPSDNRIYCMLEYKAGNKMPEYTICRIILEKVTGERLDNFLKAGKRASL